jgi:hypothetical protein
MHNKGIMLINDDDSSLPAGAYQAAVQGLALKPRNADLLFYKAWAYKVRPHAQHDTSSCSQALCSQNPYVNSSGFCFNDLWL